MACLRIRTWSFTLAETLSAWCVLLLGCNGVAALATETAEVRLVRRESEDSVDNTPNPGRWLFGSLSSADDILPIDEMLPHQLRNLAARGFDHVILYTSSKGDDSKGGDSERKKQAELFDHIRLQGMVSEFVDVGKLDIDFESAQPVIQKSAAEKLLRFEGHRVENKALVNFLTRCVLEYDHCAWLDSDIFIHRGAATWMELSVQDAIRNPGLAISLPSFGHFDHGMNKFSSRHYVYHAKQMKRLLPLTDSGGVPDTFERFLQWKIDSLSKDPQARNSPMLLYQTRSPNTWVMHPPDDNKAFNRIMTRCSSMSLSLKAVLLIVEKGHHTRKVESPTLWRKAESEDGLFDMDAEKWAPRVEEYCGKALKNSEASQLAREANDGKLHQWRPPKTHKEVGPAAKPHLRLEVED